MNCIRKFVCCFMKPEHISKNFFNLCCLTWLWYFAIWLNTSNQYTRGARRLLYLNLYFTTSTGTHLGKRYNISYPNQWYFYSLTKQGHLYWNLLSLVISNVKILGSKLDHLLNTEFREICLWGWSQSLCQWHKFTSKFKQSRPVGSRICLLHELYPAWTLSY